MKKKILSLMTVVLILTNGINVFAEDRIIDKKMPEEAITEAVADKISPDVREKMDAATDEERIPVWIWKESIDENVLEQMLMEEKNMNRADYVGNKNISASDMEAYTNAWRSIVSREYSALNDKFIEENGIENENLLYKSRYTSTLIVKATKSEIERYADREDVKGISVYEEHSEEAFLESGQKKDIPVLDMDTEMDIREDYLQLLKQDFPEDTYYQGLTLEDIYIGKYYGNYNGYDVVYMRMNGKIYTADERNLQIGGYVFRFSGSQSEQFLAYKDSIFKPVKDVYEMGDFTEKDICSMAEQHIYGAHPLFSDVSENDWFYPAVEALYNEKIITGIMTGGPTYVFDPYGYLVRAQFATILYRMEENPAFETEKTFRDVDKKEWYGKAVLWAAENGIVTGYKNGYYGPVDNITREQMASMLYRYAKYKGYDLSGTADYSAFQDVDDIQEFAKDSMNWAVANGIIKGKDLDGDQVMESLQPQGSTSRAEAAVMIRRFKEKYAQ